MAKEMLEGMDEPDLAAVLNDQHIGSQLQPGDKKKLENMVYYLKMKRKKEKEDQEKKLEQDHLISEKGMMFVSQKTFDLHQALLAPVTEEDRVKLIKSTIESNIFIFLEYMETYQLPSNDFLKIVVSLKDQVEATSFTELFVRVCRY
jgi:hypothetical protein